MYVLKNGEPTNHVDSQERAFLYGDGCFTSIKIINGQPLFWQFHAKRLLECALQLQLVIDITQIQMWVQQALVQAPQCLAQDLKQQGSLKIIISRGVGQRGYLPPQQPSDVYIQFFPSIEPQTQRFLSAECMTESGIYSGVLDIPLGHVMPILQGLKTLNRLEQVMLRQQLAQTPWPEALVVDITGHVIEGVQSNCFLYLNGQWVTPELSKCGISGVMRAVILQAMQDHAIPIQIKAVPLTALDAIQALFFCNALTGIVPVKRFNERALDITVIQILVNHLQLKHYF